MENFLIKTEDMKVDKVYGGTSVGYFFKDGNGKYWWRRLGGELQEIHPHPDLLWYEKEVTGDSSVAYLL